MTVIASRILPGSNVVATLHHDAKTDQIYYGVVIDGEFWDGDYCTMS